LPVSNSLFILQWIGLKDIVTRKSAGLAKAAGAFFEKGVYPVRENQQPGPVFELLKFPWSRR